MLYEDYERLKRLDEALKKGLITQEEYEREKAKILNGEKRSQNTSSNQISRQPLLGLEENVYLLLMHLSQFVTSFIIPIIMWLVGKDDSLRVDKHGKNIINFQISVIIWALVGVLTSILLIGIAILAVIEVMVIVFIIVAAVKAYNGEDWEYPLTIKFLK